MRISDWSSDVCSSDLGRRQNSIDPPDEPAGRLHEPRLPGVGPVLLAQVLEDLHLLMSDLAALDPQTPGDVLQAGEALPVPRAIGLQPAFRSAEHTPEHQSLMRISYAVFCLKKNTIHAISTNQLTRQTTT